MSERLRLDTDLLGRSFEKFSEVRGRQATLPEVNEIIEYVKNRAIAKVGTGGSVKIQYNSVLQLREEIRALGEAADKGLVQKLLKIMTELFVKMLSHRIYEVLPPVGTRMEYQTGTVYIRNDGTLYFGTKTIKYTLQGDLRRALHRDIQYSFQSASTSGARATVTLPPEFSYLQYGVKTRFGTGSAVTGLIHSGTVLKTRGYGELLDSKFEVDFVKQLDTTLAEPLFNLIRNRVRKASVTLR